jgi:MFS family permease
MSSDRHVLRNFLAFALPELGWGFAFALTLESPMLAAFGKAFHGTSATVGALGTVFFVGSAVPMCLTGWVVEPMARKRPFVLWGHFTTACVWGVIALGLALAAPHGDGPAWLVYVPGILVFALGLGFLLPAWLGLFGELFEERHRGRVLGLVFVFNRGGAALGGLVSQAILGGGGDRVTQWTWIFGLAFVAGTLGSLPFAWVREPVLARPPRVPLREHLAGLARAIRELPALARFVAVDAIATIAYGITFEYPDVGLRHRGFPESESGHWVEVGAIAQVGFALAIGWAGARWKPRTVLACGLASAALAAAATAFATGRLAFDAIAVAVSLFMVTRQTSHAPQVLRCSRGRDGTTPIAIAMTCIAPSQALAPLATGALVGVVGPAPVFLGLAVVAALACVLLVRVVPDGSAHPASPAPADATA